MTTYLYFFNYDLTRKVQSDMMAPSGYYNEIQKKNNLGVMESHIYYRGNTADDGYNYKSTKVLDAFSITEDMIIFEY
jgi:hypothetical protein